MLDFQIEGGAIKVVPVAKGSLEYLMTMRLSLEKSKS